MIPIKHLKIIISAALAIAIGPAGVVAQDRTDSLRSAARSAEARYERVARWLAPGTFGPAGGPCDEVVGRFCLTFDTLSKPPTSPERAQVGEARARALETLRAYLAHAPGDSQAAGPLVRLLVEAGRAEEAVAVARAFEGAGTDPAWRDWLLGYALRAAGRDSAADAAFERALARLEASERERITSIDWLLSPAERKRVGRLSTVARAAYVERFWRAADPMWLTEVNEARVEHIARRVETRLLARVPVVAGMLRWGDDLEELTVRYGTPIARQRDIGRANDGVSMIEHFDTSALVYAPESLLASGLPPVAPGERWPLRAPDGRSGHAPRSIRRPQLLAHQLTRLPRGDSMRLRLDTRIVLDGTADGAAIAMLAAWPWAGGTAVSERQELNGDTAVVTLEVLVPRDSMMYGAEVIEPATRQLHRARYLLEPLPRAPVELSDILLTEPLPEGDTTGAAGPPRALPDLLLGPGEPVGVWVEIAGVPESEAVDVEVAFDRADRPSLASRALGWAGRRLGLMGGTAPPRVRWRAVPGLETVIHVNLTAPRRPGDYVVEVLVRAAAGEASSRRLVRVVNASEAVP